MIKLEQKARLECDHAGCTESVQVRLVLLPTGGFAPELPHHVYGKWQMIMDSNNPLQPFTGKCEIHRGGRIVAASSGSGLIG